MHCNLSLPCACREEVTNPLAQVSLIDDDFGIAFELFFSLPILRRKFVVF
jgi:hypothetical protein